MTETLPRWSLPPVDFIDTDAQAVESAILTQYETAAGRSLATGDPVRLFLLTIADIIIQQRLAINTAAQQNLLTYAQGAYLDALGTFISVERLEASAATTTIKFKLSQALANAYTIPPGFAISNGKVTFHTDEELVIAPGELYGEISASCTELGEMGNGYLPGQVTTIVTPMAFLESATNTTETKGGADSESDAEYAERIRIAPNAFSVAGPTKAYIHHAYSVSSAIIDVAVTSPSPGEVNVFPLVERGELPSQELLAQVDAYLSGDDIRPLTDHVSVLAPTAHEYQIHVDYWIGVDDKAKAEAIRQSVDEAVEKYRLWQQTKLGRDIVPARLIHNVIGAGAIRIDSDTMEPSEFVTIGDGEVAKCTGVTVTYKGYKEE